MALVRPLYAVARDLRDRAESIARDAYGGIKLLDKGPIGQRQRDAAEILLPAWNAARSVAQKSGLGATSRSETLVADMPGSDVGSRRWTAARGQRDLPNTRIVGGIPAGDSQVIADRLARIPAKLIALTDRLGTRASLFTGVLTDVPGYRSLKGRRPRGWPPGASWDQVPGAGGRTGFAAHVSKDEPGAKNGHGSASLSLHEYAHTVDHALGSPIAIRISAERTWRDGPWRELRADGNASPYLRDHAEEWFAEAFARYFRSAADQAALARWYPATHDWIAANIGTDQGRRLAAT